MNARALVATGTIVTVVAASALGYYFSQVGLDKADKTASIAGLFIALAGLALSIYGIAEARKSHTPQPTNQKVTSSSISGSNIQIGQTGGSVRIKRSSSHSTASQDPPPSTPESGTAANAGQEVRGSRISGNNLQLGSSTGDVEIEES
ncbi:hypothetical protein [Streptomyces sp. NPDC050856]|uniref:hypothetical protein n=1 Tax=Streptomyces sp. NPDC050856 TaxID=3154939 RepID=UPI0033EBD5CD